MASKVLIKSYTNGLKVFIDKEGDFSEIVSEVKSIFSESRKFFKGSTIAVSFEERILTSEEERILINVMEENGDLKVAYIIGKDAETNEYFQKVLDHIAPLPEDSGVFGKVYYDTIKKGDHITSERGVVVLGDIQPGASLIASGNIVVLGGIYGTVICDGNDEANKYFIAAMDMSAEKIKIGDCKYTSKEKSKWVIKPKMQPKIAYVSQDQVIVDNISSEVLTKLSKSIKAE